MRTGSVDKLFGRVAHPGCNYLSRVGRPCLECGWQEPKEKEVSQTETSIKLGDAPLTQEARAYIAKVFPCEPPCDSYGVCDNCCEAAIFGAGYNFGYRAGMSGET